jgi:hypothetical protein
MTNKEFQELLKRYPDDMEIRIYHNWDGYVHPNRLSVNTFYKDKFLAVNDHEDKKFANEIVII